MAFGWGVAVPARAVAPPTQHTQPTQVAAPQAQQPVRMSAENMFYDASAKRVIAEGKVEIYQGESILLADKIIYDQATNEVFAEGNVVLLEVNGTVYYAERARLKDDMRDGVIDQFRVRLSDDSQFAARYAQRVDDNLIILNKAVYSPCNICEGSDPLWQLKASKVTVNQEEEQITYRNARLELYGVPILYTPYLSHPTPDAKRKSGLLLPTYSQSSNLGTTFKVPYYVNIAPDKDATLTPWITSNEGLVMEGQYRQKLNDGFLELDGSVTNPKSRDQFGQVGDGNELRGHLFARGTGAIGETTSWGFDVNHASDDTYLRRYDYGYQSTLTSRIYSQHIDGRDFARIQTMAFQGLELQDDPDASPFILPDIAGEFYSQPFLGGARAGVNIRGFTIMRDLGVDSRRISLMPSLTIPYISDGGHVIDANLRVRSDVYSVSDMQLPNGQIVDDTPTRVVPVADIGWRLPVSKPLEQGGALTVSPVVRLVASSNGNNPESIPNEDSLTPEFSELNLFSSERFAGIDRIENGSRMVYGVESSWQGSQGDSVELMLGQNYHLSGDPVYPLSRDDAYDQSDVVGYIGANVAPVELGYRFWLDADAVDINRSEVRAAYAAHGLHVIADYLYITNDLFIEDRQEIVGSASYALSPQWRTHVFGQRKLGSDGGAIIAGGGLIYENECIGVLTGVQREYTRDRDFEPNTSVTMRVALKNINSLER